MGDAGVDEGGQLLIPAFGLVSLRERPWGGQSPRDLTKGARRLFSGQRGQEHERFFKDSLQLEIFGVDFKGPVFRPVLSGVRRK